MSTQNASSAAASVPPSCNTGGITPFSLLSPTRRITYGVETSFLSFDYKKKKKVRKYLIPKDEQANARAAFVDWLSFSFKVDSFYNAFPGSQGISNDDYDCAIAIAEQLKLIFGFGATSQAKPGRHFFKSMYDLGDSGWGYMLLGGETQRGVCSITLTGSGCTAAAQGWEERLQEFLPKVMGKITRIDLTADLFEGQYTIEQAQKDYQDGLFSYKGTMPTSRTIKCSHNEGDTFYLGKKENGKELCIYQKGKQLGSALFQDWLRIELRLLSKDRVIPYDALTQCGKYLAGSYPALSFLCEDQERIKTSKAKTKVLFEKAKEVIKTQFGAYLWVISQLEESIKDLVKPGVVPARLIVPDYLNRQTTDLTLDDFFGVHPDTYQMIYA